MQFLFLLTLLAFAAKVNADGCEAITDQSTCMTSSEGSEACAWCTSGAVGTSCQKASDAQALPSAVFECSYQSAAYAPWDSADVEGKTPKKSPLGWKMKDTDCSQCTGDGPCAQCSQCVDMKDGPCEPCWSTDNAAGEACLPTCNSCYSDKAYAPYVNQPKAVEKKIESNGTFMGLGASECDAANYLRRAGFPESAVPTMVCIAKYESSFSCGATNRNTDGSTDYGMWQINSYYWCCGEATSKYNECHATCSSLMDCQANANCAKVVWRQQGYNAWYGYKNHKSTCDSYKINC